MNAFQKSKYRLYLEVSHTDEILTHIRDQVLLEGAAHIEIIKGIIFAKRPSRDKIAPKCRHLQCPTNGPADQKKF